LIETSYRSGYCCSDRVFSPENSGKRRRGYLNIFREFVVVVKKKRETWFSAAVTVTIQPRHNTIKATIIKEKS